MSYKTYAETLDVPAVDLSAWQGFAGKDYNIQKMWDSGIRVVIHKASQDTTWKDKCYRANHDYFRASGLPWLWGAYHFDGTGNGLLQAANFLEAVKDTKIDIPLFQDVEYFTPVQSSAIYTKHANYYGIPASLDNLNDVEYMPILEYRMEHPPLMMRLTPKIYKAALVSPETVDVIARKLAGYGGWAESGIYTNLASGNTLTRVPALKRLHLWAAQWSDTLERPILPTLWKPADKWILWQYGVKPGVDHGVPGSLDHDKWGNEPYPGPVPTEKKYFFSGYAKELNIWLDGELKERN
jgi:GH25 family lysozyme M1 (1,4-beta-N-acetylmuramidase)